MTSAAEEAPPVDLDAALADRRPTVLEFVHDTDVAGYLIGAGMDAAHLDRLGALLRQ